MRLVCGIKNGKNAVKSMHVLEVKAQSSSFEAGRELDMQLAS